ncbi:hypothetical protein C1H76_5866 [Elsinoe australis]|uniref:Uncharacterized protein n=1 Tax=Elsinoe australis TaxID=40998 RepID=A0A4U7AUA8_9PEZI|nr:hypothetical protein C1H76_5866 [Elsinoe australis]
MVLLDSTRSSRQSGASLGYNEEEHPQEDITQGIQPTVDEDHNGVEESTSSGLSTPRSSITPSSEGHGAAAANPPAPIPPAPVMRTSIFDDFGDYMLMIFMVHRHGNDLLVKLEDYTFMSDIWSRGQASLAQLIENIPAGSGTSELVWFSTDGNCTPMPIDDDRKLDIALRKIDETLVCSRH